jgi:hypothetical protein
MFQSQIEKWLAWKVFGQFSSLPPNKCGIVSQIGSLLLLSCLLLPIVPAIRQYTRWSMTVLLSTVWRMAVFLNTVNALILQCCRYVHYSKTWTMTYLTITILYKSQKGLQLHMEGYKELVKTLKIYWIKFRSDQILGVRSMNELKFWLFLYVSILIEVNLRVWALFFMLIL